MNKFLQQFLALTYKNVLVAWRSRRATALRLFAPVLFLLLALIVNLALTANNALQERFAAVVTSQPRPIAHVPNCASDLYIGADRPCVDFVYSPDGDATVRRVVAAVMANNEPPIPPERVVGLPNRAAADDYLVAHGDGALGAVHFTVFGNNGSIGYVVQSNSTVKYFKGAFQDPVGFFALPMMNAVARELARLYLDGVPQAPGAAAAPPPRLEEWAPRLARFPHPSLQSTNLLGQVLSSFIFASLMFGFVNQMASLVSEKDAGLRLALRNAGMLESAYWGSWMAFDAAMALVAALLLVLFGMVLQFDYFLHNDFGYLLLLFWLFGLSMTSFGYLLGVTVKRAQGAVYLGFAVFIVGWVFQTVIFISPGRLPYSPYYYYQSRYGRAFFWVFNLMPWCPFTKAILDFNEATLAPGDPGIRRGQAGSYCQYEPDPGRQPPYDPKQEFRSYDCVLPLSQVYLALAAQWLAYWVLAVYLNNVVPNEVGTRRPWLFFLTRRYWRPRALSSAAALRRVLEDEAAGRGMPPPTATDGGTGGQGGEQQEEDADVAAEERRMRRLLLARTSASAGFGSGGALITNGGGAVPSGSGGGGTGDPAAALRASAASGAPSSPLSPASNGSSGWLAGSADGGSSHHDAAGGSRREGPRRYAAELYGLRRVFRGPGLDLSRAPAFLRGAACCAAPCVRSGEQGQQQQAQQAQQQEQRRKKQQRRDFWAVRGTWLGIEQGQLFALLGPNGAGKTTTINCLTGVLPPSGGAALVYGTPIGTEGGLDAVRPLMGVCPQFDVLWGELTGREHLLVYGAVKGLPWRSLRAEAEALLDAVKLSGRAALMRSSSYSGGMKRRLSVAVALLGDPRVVYLDEPTTGMDPISRRHVWDIITAAKPGRAIVLTTHSMEEADVLGDRIGIMARGRLKALGSSLRLKQKYGAGYQLTVHVGAASAGAAGGSSADARSRSYSCLSAAEQKDLAGRMEDVRAFFRAGLGIEPLDEGRALLHYLVERASAPRLGAFLEALEARGPELGVVDVQCSLASLEEVFLTIARRAELEAAAVSGNALVPVDAPDGAELLVPLGEEEVAHPSGDGRTYAIKWAQDDAGRLVVLSASLKNAPPPPPPADVRLQPQQRAGSWGMLSAALRPGGGGST